MTDRSTGSEPFRGNGHRPRHRGMAIGFSVLVLGVLTATPSIAQVAWVPSSPSDRIPQPGRIPEDAPLGSGLAFGADAPVGSDLEIGPEVRIESDRRIGSDVRVGSGIAAGDVSFHDANPCHSCNDAHGRCGCRRHGAYAGGLLENLSLFAGLEGSKQPQDFGVNANFGGRFHANLGIPLLESEGIGLQLGTSLNYTDNAVQVFERLNGYRDRFQNFTTVGLFRRGDSGWTWAAGYDFLFQDYYDNFNLGQWRGDISYRLDRQNEFGTWFAIRGHSADGTYDTIPLTLRPITQGSLYWRRNWENDIQTTLWAGVAGGHGQANLALGDLEPVNERMVFGADVFVPISPKLAIFGQANFITPADSGTVDSFFGLAYFPGGSHGARDRRFAPRLSVANNTTFANDLRRR